MGGYGGGCGGGGFGGGGGGKGADGSRLHVANLPEGIDPSTVQTVFQTYGNVTNVHVMGNKAINGCVAAFVDYSSPQECEMAIQTLDQKYEIQPGLGPITVKRAMQRDKGDGKGGGMGGGDMG